MNELENIPGLTPELRSYIEHLINQKVKEALDQRDQQMAMHVNRALHTVLREAERLPVKAIGKHLNITG